MTPAATAVLSPAGGAGQAVWLRSASFDRIFLVGVPALSLAAGFLVVSHPVLFPLVLVADLWLLGYHHVVSTFTRLTFDADSFRRHRALVLVVPLLVAAGAAAVWLEFGLWMLISVYFYWQWFHYTRQSYGVFRIYARRSGAPHADSLTPAVIYAVATWGVLGRSAEAPEKFLRLEIGMLPVPVWWVWLAGTISIGLLGWWLARQLLAYRAGTLSQTVFIYVLSHVVIFVSGYLLVDNMDHGWLIVNMWHNMQYIALVWMFNNNRFKHGVDARHRFLSFISQRRQWLLYLFVCFGISTVVYAGLSVGLSRASAYFAWAAPVPLALIAFQVINFHHYIADAVIWKTRTAHVADHLGLSARPQ